MPSAAASSRRAPAKKGGAVAAGSARGGTATSARSGFSSSSTQKPGGVVKTIVLPHEDINRLGTEAQELMQMLQGQKQLFEDTVQGYQKDRSVRTQEFDLKAQDFETTIAELEARLANQTALNYQISNDYFNYRHSIGNVKQKLDD